MSFSAVWPQEQWNMSRNWAELTFMNWGHLLEALLLLFVQSVLLSCYHHSAALCSHCLQCLPHNTDLRNSYEYKQGWVDFTRITQYVYTPMLLKSKLWPSYYSIQCLPSSLISLCSKCQLGAGQGPHSSPCVLFSLHQRLVRGGPSAVLMPITSKGPNDQPPGSSLDVTST